LGKETFFEEKSFLSPNPLFFQKTFSWPFLFLQRQK